MQLIAILLLVMFGCGPSGDENGILVFSDNYDFALGQDSWEVDFTDFPAAADDSVYYELNFSYTDRPSNLGENLKSMMLSGYNHESLFMFMKKKITGLTPYTDYALVFDVELASNAPRASLTPGIASGESVFLKAGATGIEPQRVIDGSYFTLNVDKGPTQDPGEATVVLGDISVDTDNGQYALITRNNAENSTTDSQFIARSNSRGELWLIIGTDSESEGGTTVYYTKVNVVFSAAN